MESKLDIGNTYVSVIIPVYNAEDTLFNCLDSLKNQTYRKMELIFIDDSSADRSLEILEQFADALKSDKDIIVKIFTHAVNQGVAAARNTGLDHATGEYIYYIDADDRIEDNSIEMVLLSALEEKADIVGFNWYLTFNKNERKMNQSSFSSPLDAIEKILRGEMRWNLWLFMVRRRLYEDNAIRFSPGKNMGEDLMVMVKLFVHAKTVCYIDQAFYHYGQSNTTSLTKTYSKVHMDEVTSNVREVERYVLNSKFGNQTAGLIPFLKLNIKLPLLISAKKSNYRLWLSWFPEANSFVLKNKTLALRIRILQWCALKKQFWAIQGYYNIVFRFVYGVLYK